MISVDYNRFQQLCDSMISSRDAPNYPSSHKSFQDNKERGWVSGKNFEVKLELDPGSAFQLTYKFRQILSCPDPSLFLK